VDPIYPHLGKSSGQVLRRFSRLFLLCVSLLYLKLLQSRGNRADALVWGPTFRNLGAMRGGDPGPGRAV
jgi:hypothetical protein